MLTPEPDMLDRVSALDVDAVCDGLTPD